MTDIALNSKEIDRLAKIIWDYMKVEQSLQKADCILGLGSHDIRVADRAAELYLQGFASIIIFSGGIGRLTYGKFDRPEAEIFADRAIELGVPKEQIINEDKSSNTGENIQFTKVLLEKLDLHPKSFIVVHKPYMERRAFATFKKNWPDREIIMTSPQFSYEEYPNKMITREDIINIMVGDLQRILIYPRKGFQIYQEVPENVKKAYEKLAEMGYDKELIKE